jgi:hypothetical protein
VNDVVTKQEVAWAWKSARMKASSGATTIESLLDGMTDDVVF